MKISYEPGALPEDTAEQQAAFEEAARRAVIHQRNKAGMACALLDRGQPLHCAPRYAAGRGWLRRGKQARETPHQRRTRNAQNRAHWAGLAWLGDEGAL